MQSAGKIIEERVGSAIKKAFPQGDEKISSGIQPSSNPSFGDYQCNVAMGLAKDLKTDPREIAATIVRNLDIEDICQPPEIAGAGFINFKLRPDYLTTCLRGRLCDPRLGVEKAAPALKVVIDFSGPNIAKELHVGHLRSTIIGDSIARLHEFLGHQVLRRNHVGDWGTQFGMLICYLKEKCPEILSAGRDNTNLADINTFYKEAKQRFDDDEEFKVRSKNEVVALQSGDAENRRWWEYLCDLSRREFSEIYNILNVEIEEKGESFYNRFIEDTLAELRAKKMIEISDGAHCVFPDKSDDRTINAPPLIAQKSDGGHTYDTTDLTAIRYRVKEERAGKIIYVTDAGQAQHFAVLFSACRKAGWLDNVEVVHVPFGVVLREDKKRLKTRSGESIKLRALLDEAVVRARAIVDAKNPDLSQEIRDEISRAIGISAVKYADLSFNRLTDYIFSFDKMLSLQGNTAPYLLYAYVRIQGIVRKLALESEPINPNDLDELSTPEELSLGVLLERFPDVISTLAVNLSPHYLTDYLYGLAQGFSVFYTNNRVVGDPREKTRLCLCDLTARTLKLGLSLLGIQTLGVM